MSNASCLPRRTKTGRQSNRIKFFRLTNGSSNYLAQIEGSMCDKVLAESCITPTVKYEGGSVMMLVVFANWNVEVLYQVKGKSNQSGYHSIVQYLVIPSGTQHVGQGFVLMQDNDPKHTSKLCQRYIKSKEEWLVLGLVSLTAQSAD